MPKTSKTDFGVPFFELAETENGLPPIEDLCVVSQISEVGPKREKKLCYTVWDGDSGTSCASNPDLAKRLVKAIQAGHGLREFLGRTLNADLRRKGF